MKKVFRFKIELLDTKPLIWRRIEVPGNYSFWDLHVAIQDAMGWTDSHLHVFEVLDAKGDRVEIGIPDQGGSADFVASWSCKLSKYFKNPGNQYIYEYDFGDAWRHLILLEAVSSPESGMQYPRCLAGARNCPPEDCGGPYGFEDFLEAIADPKHEDHKDLLDWCGGHYDAVEFDPEAVKFDDPDDRREFLL